MSAKTFRTYAFLITVVLAALTLLRTDVAQAARQDLKQQTERLVQRFGLETTGTPQSVELDNPATRIDRHRARQQLSQLRVRRPAAMAGYDRKLFKHWRDVEPNGCDAREDALLRWGTAVKRGAYCKVLAGSWFDPYSAKTYTNPRQMDIDHVVTLAEAWRSGAHAWPQAKRRQFANDQLVLIPTYRSINRSKGDRPVTSWLPPSRQWRDDYAVRWIMIKSQYKLSITPAEKRVLAGLIAG